MILNKILFLIFFSCGSMLSAQKKDISLIKNGIDKPSILATHHFGIFSSRINQNFKINSPKKPTLTVSYENGNNFHPFIEAYFPKDKEVREELSNVIWYQRNFNFIDQNTTPADYLNIIIDAVIKEFRLDINFPVSKQHELGITLRSYLITRGKRPFSFFTSDESVEWFHTNIAGGEDPYGRKYYGLNQVNFKYTDRNGNVLELYNNDFFLGGIEFNYFYYPSFLINKKQNLFVNFGFHTGINSSKFNPSLDIGISTNMIKKIMLKNGNEFHFAIGGSLLHKNIINFNNVIDLGNNTYLGSYESEIEFTKYTKKKNYHAFGINYQLQTRFNKLKEASYYKLLGKWKEINAGWQNGVSTLYEKLSAWTFLYTYAQPNYKIMLFIKEDILVNNAPDVQTGISVKIPILN